MGGVEKRFLYMANTNDAPSLKSWSTSEYREPLNEIAGKSLPSSLWFISYSPWAVTGKVSKCRNVVNRTLDPHNVHK